MTDLTRYGNGIGVVGVQHTGNRMAEHIWIDMRQIMPFAEFIKSFCNAVWVPAKCGRSLPAGNNCSSFADRKMFGI